LAEYFVYTENVSGSSPLLPKFIDIMTYYTKIQNIKLDVLTYYQVQYDIIFNYITLLQNIIPKYVLELKIDNFDLELYTTPNNLNSLLFFLKNNTNSQFKILTDIIAYDIPGKSERFIVVYSLLSIHYNTRISVIVTTDELTPLPSVCNIYSGAAWLEREVWDLFGIYFYNHPDLRRILTDYGFEGHPLRKDFPLTGFVEVFYDDIKKRVVYEPVSLAQEYRNFNFKNPWAI
jgi:NADH dehydrogenase (ubiquinone) Fe-S protein 3